MGYRKIEKRNLLMSFLRHKAINIKIATVKQWLFLYYIEGIKLSLVGCSPAEPSYVLLDTIKMKSIVQIQTSL